MSDSRLDGIEDNGEAIPAACDNKATAEFVRAHIGWMLRLARCYMGEMALAEDVVQNAFSKVFSNAHQFSGRSTIRSWIRRIVVNEALMLLRKHRTFREDGNIDPLLPEFDTYGCRIEEPWQEVPTSEQLIITRQSNEQIMSAIDRLPEAFRIVLLLRDIEEHTTLEVADILGISEANVKVRLHRARAALKSLLEPLMRAGEMNP